MADRLVWTKDDLDFNPDPGQMQCDICLKRLNQHNTDQWLECSWTLALHSAGAL